jgi:uncharacterized membrane protein
MEGIIMRTRQEIKVQAKSQIKGNIGAYFLASIIYGGLAMVTFWAVVLIPPLSMSFTIFSLEMARNREIKAGDVFKGFNLFGKALWLAIITGFFVSVWSLLLIVPGIIKAYSYSMAPYILADNPDMTAREALRESKRITQGYKGELFVLDLSFIGWRLLAIPTLGLISIWLSPYTSVSWANYYLELSGRTPGLAYGEHDEIEGYGVQEEDVDEMIATIPLVEEAKGNIMGLQGSFAGYNIDLPSGEEIIIGKDAKVASIVIDTSYKEISRKHVGISYDASQDVYRVTDYSSNGTWANDVKVQPGAQTIQRRGTVLKLANDKNTFRLG